MTTLGPVTSNAPPLQAQRAVPQHISWSALETYRDCPRKYALRYIEQVPEERCSAALLHGSALHRVLEQVHQARMEGRPVSTVEVLLHAYDQGWREEAEGKPALVFSKNDDEARLRDLAGRTLVAYLAWLNGDTRQRQTIAIEHEALFSLAGDLPPIHARVDLVEVVGDELHVVDWKTSRSRWSDQKAREKLGQLVIYSFALLPLVKALGVRRVVPRFVVLTRTARCPVQVVEPKATREDARMLKDQVRETWQAIQARVFPRRESWQCKQCPFRVRCLGR